MKKSISWAGDESSISKINGNSIFQAIPQGIWEPIATMQGVFLNLKADEFKFNHKIYGLEEEFIEHVLKTYEHSAKNVGVLLNGLKGAGKTVTAKILANRSNLPIIVLNHNSMGLLNYFEDVEQPLCIFIDEFEKNINHNDSEKIAPILSFTDGTSVASKHLLIFTSNSKNISNFFIDRPSRIRYIKQYGNLPETTVKEILHDFLINKEFAMDIVNWVKNFRALTIDMLMSIIGEVNTHNMSPKKFSSFFNADNEPNHYKLRVHITDPETLKTFEWNTSEIVDCKPDQYVTFLKEGDTRIPLVDSYSESSRFGESLDFLEDEYVTESSEYYVEGKHRFLSSFGTEILNRKDSSKVIKKDKFYIIELDFYMINSFDSSLMF